MIYDKLDKKLRKIFTLDDVTAVYAVRVTEHNPWVAERVNNTILPCQEF